MLHDNKPIIKEEYLTADQLKITELGRKGLIWLYHNILDIEPFNVDSSKCCIGAWVGAYCINPEAPELQNGFLAARDFRTGSLQFKDRHIGFFFAADHRTREEAKRDIYVFLTTGKLPQEPISYQSGDQCEYLQSCSHAGSPR